MMAHNLCYSTYVMDETTYGNILGLHTKLSTLAIRPTSLHKMFPVYYRPFFAELKQFRKKAKEIWQHATGYHEGGVQW